MAKEQIKPAKFGDQVVYHPSKHDDICRLNYVKRCVAFVTQDFGNKSLTVNLRVLNDSAGYPPHRSSVPHKSKSNGIESYWDWK